MARRKRREIQRGFASRRFEGNKNTTGQNNGLAHKNATLFFPPSDHFIVFVCIYRHLIGAPAPFWWQRNFRARGNFAIFVFVLRNITLFAFFGAPLRGHAVRRTGKTGFALATLTCATREGERESANDMLSARVLCCLMRRCDEVKQHAMCDARGQLTRVRVQQGRPWTTHVRFSGTCSCCCCC